MKPEFFPILVGFATFLGMLTVVLIGFLFSNARISDVKETLRAEIKATEATILTKLAADIKASEAVILSKIAELDSRSRLVR